MHRNLVLVVLEECSLGSQVILFGTNMPKDVVQISVDEGANAHISLIKHESRIRFSYVPIFASGRQDEPEMVDSSNHVCAPVSIQCKRNDRLIYMISFGMPRSTI